MGTPFFGRLVVVVTVLAMAACGSSGGGSSGSSTSSAGSSADSLSDLPSTSSLVTGGGTSASLSAKSLKAATGTPPLLKDLSASNVDTYFWNGLIATLKSASLSSITQAQRDAFWQGEGACRMAQAVGYAFQHISQGGISLCYMQNAPSAANGVSITSGDATAANIFDQGAASKVVKVSVSGSESGGETIFIKVYGTGTTEGSAGYAADLWFCSSAGAPSGSEEIRVNSSANTIALTSIHKDFGSFVSTIAASLTTNSSGQIIFDSSKERSATVYFGSSDSMVTFLGSVVIDKDELLTARDYWNGTFGQTSTVNKHAVFANYTGDSMETLRFSQASFALQDDFGKDISNINSNIMSISDATEFSTSRYVNVDSGTLLSTAQAEKFDENIYSGTSSSQYTSAVTKLNAVSSLNCSTTPDVVVAMDFTQSGPKAVQSKCEKVFANMNFCDGDDIRTARSSVFDSQRLQGGSCTTSFCADDFSCQLWADNNRGNSAGITTANAKCSSGGCCTTQ